MNDKFNKALLDLVVKTANDLSKYHADQTLDLVAGEIDDKVGVFDGQVKDLHDFIAKLGNTQSGQRDSIDELVEKLAEIRDEINERIKKDNSFVDDSFGNVNATIHEIKVAINELSDIVDSNDNINALADGVQDLERRLTADIKAGDGLVESFIEDITKVNEALVRVTDDVASNDEVLQERIDMLGQRIKDSTENISKVFDIHQAAHDEAMTDVLKDVAGFDEKVTTLKASLIGYGDDLATLSKDLHTKVITLRDCKVDHDGQLDKLHASVAKFESDNAENIHSVEKLVTALSEQFSELKNESFLSADKIDTKFAEIRLALVESDVQRTEAIKESIYAFETELKESIDVTFKSYQADMDERITGDTRSLIDSVDKMLATDKQLLARAKHWQSGVEYGPSVIVRNLGGVWQSRAATCDEPTVDSDDWYCLSSSFHKTSIIKQHLNGIETVIGIHDSLGNVHELSIPVPSIRYLKGVYDPAATYDHLDSIMKDGCRWVATKDEPEGVPGDDDADWQVLTMRGPKGFKGATGERGPKGKTGEKGNQGDPGIPGPSPEMNSIVKAVVDYEANGEGQPIRRARGNWNIKNTYRAGDVVSVGRGLFVCLKDNDGTQNPGSTTEDWLLLVEASGGGSTGTGGGGDITDTNTAPTFDIEQLAAEIPSVPDNYPVDVDTVEADEVQVRLQVSNRAAGNYIVNWHTHHNIDATNNSVLTRYSTDGGSTWHESSRESADVTDEIEKYIAVPFIHGGGAVDVVLQMRKENVANTLVVRAADIWLDAKFIEDPVVPETLTLTPVFGTNFRILR